MTNPQFSSRREFIRKLGLSAAALPLLGNLPSLASEAAKSTSKQRLIILFSPNGIVPKTFWPDEQGDDFQLKPILSPLAKYQDRMLVLRGVSEKVRGDGDSHMRGIGCLLTGIELFPGNIQGGSHTPAGWASGHSIDQELKRFLQANEATQTRFGSLEFGVNVPDRADTWTRMCYAGPNKPITPIDDPYQMFNKLYGRMQDEQLVRSILDDVLVDLQKVKAAAAKEDRQLLEEHTTLVRELEKSLQTAEATKLDHVVPDLEPGVKEVDENFPKLSKMQIDLLVQSLAADFTRVATLQFTNSVSNAKMSWLGFSDSHHSLSHKPTNDKSAQEKLTKINRWYCEQMAYLVEKLENTPEPGGEGSMLDHTTVVWTNELGEGNSHTLDNIPFVLVGGGLGFKTGRSLKFNNTPHHRLLLSFAHAFGHHIEHFGNPDYCGEGPLNLN